MRSLRNPPHSYGVSLLERTLPSHFSPRAMHLVWFEHSAHTPITEEPGKFLLSLVRCARPIAEKAGDVAP